VPVGDWMWRPYGPYIGCTDGALEHFDRLLNLAAKYQMKVLIDIHALEGSQNGLDNSGNGLETRWRTNAAAADDAEETWETGEHASGTTFTHWPSRKAEWMGSYDLEKKAYTTIDWGRLEATLDVVRNITEMYATNAAVMGLQPVNEPWQFTPIGPLQRFYWEGFKIVKRRAPGWKWFMHDSFRLHSGLWRHFMKGCPGIMLDTHIYQAWNRPAEPEAFYSNACAQKHTIAEYEDQIMPVVVGEWSLATDNCAMWLNGARARARGPAPPPLFSVPAPAPPELNRTDRTRGA
jgi:glucan 1,3-beta-glucosidase